MAKLFSIHAAFLLIIFDIFCLFENDMFFGSFHLCAPTANYFLEYYMTFTKEKNVSTDIR